MESLAIIVFFKVYHWFCTLYHWFGQWKNCENRSVFDDVM